VKTSTSTARTLRSPRRPGFTLLEVLLVIGVLTMALALLAVASSGAIKLHQACAGALDRLGAQQALADQFRADVARAAEAPDRWQEEVAGPRCLILRLGENGHVLYRWEADRLERAESAGDKPQWRPMPLGGPAVAEFIRTGASGRLVTLRLSAVRKGGGKDPPAEITAALGGDRQ
jgi:type II secretory pathway pseudopilin PulG